MFKNDCKGQIKLIACRSIKHLKILHLAGVTERKDRGCSLQTDCYPTSHVSNLKFYENANVTFGFFKNSDVLDLE